MDKMDKPKITLKNAYGHFKTVCTHKWEVGKADLQAGLYWEAFAHDFSKFTWHEFWESARFYQEGKKSPVFKQRDLYGYSSIELHHHAHNPHHWEFWINDNFGGVPIKIPVIWVRKMFCDMIGAGKVYEPANGRVWTRESTLKFLEAECNQRKVMLLHPETKKLLFQIAKDFIDMGYEAVRKKHVDKIAQELDYDNVPNCYIYGENLTDLNLPNHAKKQEQPEVPKQKVGILGGTFNPIHKGHLEIAKLAMEMAGLDKVIFLPAGAPPWKSKGVSAAEHRVEMVKLAIEDNPKFELSLMEIERQGESNTIDTIHKLQYQNPDIDYHFILGADTFMDILKFKSGKELARILNFICVSREGIEDDTVNKHIINLQERFNTNVIYLKTDAANISSTMVREGKSGLLHQKVQQYVQDNELYIEEIKAALKRECTKETKLPTRF